jgi:hypothetical protein
VLGAPAVGSDGQAEQTDQPSLAMRMILFWAAGAVSTSLFGCAGSPPPPADQPEPAQVEERAPPAEPAPTPARKAEPADAETSSVEGGEPRATERPEDSVPDDYTIMHGDCAQLGKKFAALTRAEQVAALSPKLTTEQRTQTEQRIDVVAGKLGEQYAQTCEKNVGRSVNPRSLKCAFDARSVKAFDECLNGPPPSK